MGIQVAFDYTLWSNTFPSLAPYLNSAQATACFNMATLYQANDGSGPICDPTQALSLLNLLTSHIAVLTYPTTGPIGNPDPPSPLVGRVNSATEGSVSVSAENNYPAGTPQWYQQTVWGSSWWAATSQFRTMHYVPSCTPRGPFGPWGFRGGYG
jgi:uncharacterized protein DUF4054